MEDLPLEFLIENCSITVEFLENKARVITAGAICCLLQKLKIVFDKL